MPLRAFSWIALDLFLSRGCPIFKVTGGKPAISIATENASHMVFKDSAMNFAKFPLHQFKWYFTNFLFNALNRHGHVVEESQMSGAKHVVVPFVVDSDAEFAFVAFEKMARRLRHTELQQVNFLQIYFLVLGHFIHLIQDVQLKIDIKRTF